MKFLLIFLSFFNISPPRDYHHIIYNNYYILNGETHFATTVVVIKKDSICAYIYNFQYVWWKIEASQNVSRSNNGKELISARYTLAYKDHKSYMIVSPKAIIHTILLNGEPPIVFTVEMIRKRYKKQRK